MRPGPGRTVLEPPWALSPSCLSVSLSQSLCVLGSVLDFQPWQRGRCQKCPVCGTTRAWPDVLCHWLPATGKSPLGPTDPAWAEEKAQGVRRVPRGQWGWGGARARSSHPRGPGACVAQETFPPRVTTCHPPFTFRSALVCLATPSGCWEISGGVAGIET